MNLSELISLRKLEIYINKKPWLWDKNVIVEQNTISRLSCLEELSLTYGICIREKCAKSGSLSVLDEVSELSCLTSLQITSKDSKSSKLATIFSNLREFDLFVGERPSSIKASPVTKSIKLSNHDHVEGYQTLIEKAEEVILCDTNFTGSSIDIEDNQKFMNLKYMEIKDCTAIEYLASMSPRYEIQESFNQSIPFSNLLNLTIKNCQNLEYLFCNSVARCLEQLQELQIKKCPKMKEVVLGKGTSDGNIINMSKLRVMILTDLPRLIHFYKDNTFSDQIQPQPLFNQMVRLLDPLTHYSYSEAKLINCFQIFKLHIFH